jgi:hypothetical protein
VKDSSELRLDFRLPITIKSPPAVWATADLIASVPVWVTSERARRDGPATDASAGGGNASGR